MRGAGISKLVPIGRRTLIKIDVEALNQTDAAKGYNLFQLDSSGLRERVSFVAGKNRDFALTPAADERAGFDPESTKAGIGPDEKVRITA